MDRVNSLFLRVLCPAIFALALFCIVVSAAKTQEPRESDTYDNFVRNDDAGPVRLARFSSVHGDVAWRPDDQAEWSDAAINLPLRQSAEVWAPEGARAEIQFDDGTQLRLGSRTLVTLRTLFSDADGEFTQVTVKDGTAALRLTHNRSVYQMDTPYASVSARGPAKIRLNVGDEVQISVLSGSASVEGRDDKVTLRSGEYLALRDDNSRFEPRDLPSPDGFDRWNEDRDRYDEESYDRPSRRYLPANISLVANDLDDYGSWHRDSQYGEVWSPRVTTSEWRPYRYGRWVWVNPFGWTWVSDEPWGWAPYHYGTWAHTDYGWGWVPGPAQQYWCPAVVNFCEQDGQVAWTPLAPAEVRYPSALSIGFRGRDWSFYFSIGQAAVYYPTYERRCEPRPFNTVYVNRVVNVTNVYNNTTVVNNYNNTTVVNRNTYLAAGDRAFVPMNARHGGVMVAAASAFGSHGHYQTATGDASSLFSRGHVVAAPALGNAPVAGPIAVRPTAAATTPTRTFLHGAAPSSNVASRPVFSRPVDPQIVRGSRPILPSGAPAPVRERTDVRTAYPRDLRNSRERVAPDGRTGIDRPGQPSTLQSQVTRDPDRPRASLAAPRRDEAAGRVPTSGYSRPERVDAFPSAQPSVPQRDTQSNVNRAPLPERSWSRDSAAEAAMRARSNLGLPTRERPAIQSPTDSRQNERRWTGDERNSDRPRRTLPGYEDGQRVRVPESPRRLEPPARAEVPLLRNESPRRAPDLRSFPSERPVDRRIETDFGRPRRTLPGYGDASSARTPESPRRLEPPTRTDSPFSSSDSPRRAPNKRSYSAERPADRRIEPDFGQTRRPRDTYAEPTRRETPQRTEPRPLPESGSESHGRREPVYRPEVSRPAESYSQPVRREPQVFRSEPRRTPESYGESMRRESTAIRREPARVIEIPRRDAAPSVRSQDRASDSRARQSDTDSTRGKSSKDRQPDSSEGRDRRPHN